MELELSFIIIIILISVVGYQLFVIKKITKNNKENKLFDINSLERKLDANFEKLIEMNTVVSNASNNVGEMYTLLTKGGSVAGKFGELSLKVLLEKAGLVDGTHFHEQMSISDKILDIILDLPDKKKVIIDSKVSLSDYNDYLKSGDTKLRKSL